MGPLVLALTVAFTEVTVIDMTGAPPRSRQTVVVEQGRIAASGPAGSVRVPEGAHVVDGRGRYLIPGLWDLHVHFWYDEPFFPLYLANGVTGVRDMGSNLRRVRRWQQEATEGSKGAPRIVAPGDPLGGPDAFWPNMAVAGVRTREEARAAVRRAREAGADFVKVLSEIPRDPYLAAAEEARELGLTLSGHLPAAVSPSAAADAGQRTFEHLFSMAVVVSDRENELRSAVREAAARNDQAASRRAWLAILDSYDPVKAKALYLKLEAAGVWQVPSLTLRRRMAGLHGAAADRDERLAYVPPSIRRSWGEPPAAPAGEEARELARRAYAHAQRQVREMRAAGVGILAGTDTGDPFTYPGFELHDELALLVDAGLTPEQALQSATRDAARFLGLGDRLGTVEAGKEADLVLLEGDPLADIANTRRVAAVVARGTLLNPRALLQQARDDARADRFPAARAWREALAARQARDDAGYRDAVRRVLVLRPEDAAAMYELARAHARLGDRREALGWLAKVAGFGLGFHPGTDDAFAALGTDPEFRALLARIEGAAERPTRSRVRVGLPDREMIPEGVAYDPVGRRLFVGSLKRRKIVVVDADGRARDFVAENEHGLEGVLGMKVDAARGHLWACSNADGRAGPRRGEAALFRFDLGSGRLLGRAVLPPTPEPHLLNDLALTAAGDVYVTDSASGAVHRLPAGGDALQEFLPGRTFTYPNGIALSEDGRVLYVASHGRGVSAVDLATREVTDLATGTDATLAGIDGLYVWRGALLAVQNGLDAGRIMRFELSPERDRVTKAELLDSRHPTLAIPTTGAVAGDRFLYVANSHVDQLLADGTLKEPGALTGPIVLELDLPRVEAEPPRAGGG